MPVYEHQSRSASFNDKRLRSWGSRQTNQEIGYLVAFHVRQVLCHGDDSCKRGHESCNEGDLGTPLEGRADRILHGIVNAEIQQKSSHGCNRKAGEDRVPLGSDGRDGIGRPQHHSQTVQVKQDGREEVVNYGRSDGGRHEDRHPRETSRHLSARHRQERLVHHVNFLVEDLVDPDDECVAKKKGHHPYEGAGEHRTPLHRRKRPGRVQQGPDRSRHARQDGPSDGVGTGELVDDPCPRLNRPLFHHLLVPFDRVRVKVALHRHA